MENKYFLAIDIGASSGRHILGWIENGKFCLKEIYRFKNGAVSKGDKLVWDVQALYNEIIEGIKQCKILGTIPESIGIDTWGVDYALLDENDNLIDEIFSYRDERTLDVIDKVHDIIPEEQTYQKTGVQKLVYNTIYQLYCDKLSNKLFKAKTFLFVPDYLHFLLTGVKSNEYTIASTSGLLNAKTRDWDFDLIDKLGYPRELFNKLSMPGTIVGKLKKEIEDYVGFSASVCLPASHDTASAVLAVPSSENPLYISSGTWSIIGIETQKDNTSEIARVSGFSNEGGYNKSIRFLKNIMGLWMIQFIKKEYNDKYSFVDFVDLANTARDFKSVVDVNDLSFFSPNSMITAVKDYCQKTNQQVPQTVGEIVMCVYNSLALYYKKATEEIEKISSTEFKEINIVGGGCQNVLLNELTAYHTGKKVVAGPVEATATGNILAQMLANGCVSSVAEGKKLIKDSFEIKEIMA